MQIESINLKGPKRLEYYLLCQLSIYGLSGPNPPFLDCSVITEMSSASISPLPAGSKLSLVSRGHWMVGLCLFHEAPVGSSFLRTPG